MNEADLVDLKSLGNIGSKIEFTKIESPVGNVLPWKKSKKNPKKIRSRRKIILVEPIEVDKKIIKKGMKKTGKIEIPKKYYATLSKVEKIERRGEKYFVLTGNSKYSIKFLS